MQHRPDVGIHRRVEGRPRLDEPAAHDPEPALRDCQTDERVAPSPHVHRESECAAEVGRLAVLHRQPFVLGVAAREDPVPRSLGDFEVAREVATTQPLRLAALSEQRLRVLADRLEQHEALAAAAHQARLDQRGERIAGTSAPLTASRSSSAKPPANTASFCEQRLGVPVE